MSDYFLKECLRIVFLFVVFGSCSFLKGFLLFFWFFFVFVFWFRGLFGFRLLVSMSTQRHSNSWVDLGGKSAFFSLVAFFFTPPQEGYTGYTFACEVKFFSSFKPASDENLADRQLSMFWIVRCWQANGADVAGGGGGVGGGHTRSVV